MPRSVVIPSSLATPAAAGNGPGRLAAGLRRLWPGDAVRNRVLERVRQRRGTQELPFTLVYRNIFVLPTGFGTGFAILLILTALGGLNFNNNLALLMVFVLGSLAQMTNLLAYRNLTGLTVVSVRSEPVFAGDPLHLQVLLQNPDDRFRYSLELSLARETSGDCRDLQPGQHVTFRLALPTERRGWLAVPPLRLQTRYPLAVFHVWSWLFPTQRCLVYPVPAKNPPPLPASGDGRSGESRRGAGDQLYGLRNYRTGDALKTIAWRTSARHGQFYTKEMETPQEAACVLDYGRLEGRDREARISILTAWVLMAEHRTLPYRLELPGLTLPADSGPAHRAACLEALALFES